MDHSCPPSADSGFLGGAFWGRGGLPPYLCPNPLQEAHPSPETPSARGSLGPSAAVCARGLCPPEAGCGQGAAAPVCSCPLLSPSTGHLPSLLSAPVTPMAPLGSPGCGEGSGMAPFLLCHLGHQVRPCPCPSCERAVGGTSYEGQAGGGVPYGGGLNQLQLASPHDRVT